MAAVAHHPTAGQIGRPSVRVEAVRLIAGEGRLVDDLILPNPLDLALVRSRCAPDCSVRVDATAARAATKES